MDPTQVKRDPDGIMRCSECGFRYDLQPDEVVDRADAGLQAVRTAVLAVPEDRLSLRPSPEVWSVNAYTRHLVDAAQVILARVAAIVEHDRPALAYHDQDRAVAELNADSIPAADSLPLLETAVRQFRERIRSLPHDAWHRAGVHERAGEIRLSEIAHDMAHELQHHAMDIRRSGGVSEGR